MIHNCSIEYILAPLDKKMYLDGTDAEEIFFSIIKEFAKVMFRADEHYKTFGAQENPFVVRIFLASSRGFQKFRDSDFIRNDNLSLAMYYRSIALPRFVWVCEVSEIKQYGKKVAGEFVIDAAATKIAPMDALILANTPGHIIYKSADDARGKQYGRFNDEI